MGFQGKMGAYLALACRTLVLIDSEGEGLNPQAETLQFLSLQCGAQIVHSEDQCAVLWPEAVQLESLR